MGPCAPFPCQPHRHRSDAAFLWGREKPVTVRAKKTVQTTDLTEALRQAQAVILTDYRGFNVAELAQLRGQLSR